MRRLLALLVSPLAVAHPGHVAPAEALLKKLAPHLEDRSALVRPFADPERKRWNYFPGSRAGVPLERLPSQFRGAVLDGLDPWLSDSGRKKVDEIVFLEGVLGARQGFLRFATYDPAAYTLALFGEPGPKGPWGLRFEGHHLSLNFTHDGDKLVSLAPFFLGANPSRHEQGAKRVQPFREEEERARALVLSMTASQRAQAIFSSRALSEIVLTPGRDLRTLEPRGIAYSSLSEPQRRELERLVLAYLENFEEPIRAPYATRVAEELPSAFFGWAGSVRPGEGHYYRVQAKSFVIEYDNTQDGANHVHTVWHDLENDFGDALLEHYGKQH